jgi:hypothetical protein
LFGGRQKLQGYGTMAHIRTLYRGNPKVAINHKGGSESRAA